MSHYRGWRRPLLILLLVGVAGGAGYYFVFHRGVDEGGDSTAAKEEKAAGVPVKPMGEGQREESATVPAEQAEDKDDPVSPTAPAALTEQRTWTARDGRSLEAALLSLSLVDGQYVGVFEKPGGETFRYKIGNLSAADVELVKGIVGKE